VSLSLVLILGLGITLRVLFFPQIPPGLNQDEASAAYEAYSLLLTGQDRWGNPWPIYFPGWGSGQNALYSYLSIPIIWQWGLTRFSTRLVNLLLGILTLPLLYLCVRQTYSRRAALLSTLLLAVLPWHVMMSRWGLESNLLPFFLLLGVYSIHRALTPASPRLSIVLALVPWAICLYAYGLACLLIPPFLLLIFMTYRRQVIADLRYWCGAITLFALLTFPFLLFLVKNNLLHQALGFEQFLPFSIPLLLSQRLDQTNTGLLEGLIPNLKFVLNGFNDHLIWNSPQYFLPLGITGLPLLLAGLLQGGQKPSDDRADLFRLWIWAAVPLLLTVTLNLNRANGLLIPVLVLTVVGFESIRVAIVNLKLRKLLVRSTACWLALNTIFFGSYYLSTQDAYSDRAAVDFQAGLDNALAVATELATPTEAIFVTPKIPLNYVYVLFWRRIHPHDFHRQAHYTIEEGTFAVHNWQNFYFDRPSLQRRSQPTFIYVLQASEPPLCASAPLYQTQLWQVGRCQ
jgi:4-amino-4-deoxy-L-arabinose transferase-like glycosyltransferase